MTQPPPRTRVEFSPESIRRRQFASRCFRVFALCATFFGLAMLVVFLGRLVYDVVGWFRATPGLIQRENASLEEVAARLRDPAGLKAARLARLRDEMEAEIRATPEADRERVRREWERDVIPAEQANDERTLDELRREVEAGYRPDTSPGAILGHFLSSGPAPEDSPQDAGIWYGLLGTLWLVAITLVVALPVGVGAAIYLEEYRSTSRLAGLIQININNLAGVPSVLFGILGAFVFVELIFRPLELEIERPARIAEYRVRYDRLRETGQIPDEDADLATMVRRVVDPAGSGAEALVRRIEQDTRRLSPPNVVLQAFGSLCRSLGISVAARNVLGGGLTLALLILPVLIVASQEAIRAVPTSLRHGSLALGATRWQTIWRVVLPSAAPGILTGTILAMCRAMGEAAPLVLFGATLYVDEMPGLFSRFTVMPMQVFVWSDRVSPAWRQNAALASFVLLLLLLSLNALAIYLRQRAQSQGNV